MGEPKQIWVGDRPLGIVLADLPAGETLAHVEVYHMITPLGDIVDIEIEWSEYFAPAPGAEDIVRESVMMRYFNLEEPDGD